MSEPRGIVVGNGWRDYGAKPFIVIVRTAPKRSEFFMVPARDARSARLTIMAFLKLRIEQRDILMVVEPDMTKPLALATLSAGR
jgi:polyphosphate kinase 2 (PPK2 family)